MNTNPRPAPRSFRIPPDLMDRLTIRALQEGRSINNLVVLLLKQALPEPVKNVSKRVKKAS